MDTQTARMAGIPSPAAAAARAILFRRYRTYGIAVAVLSGMSYGLYTAFMTLGMSLGVWDGWYADGSGLSAVASLFLLSALGAAVTDSFSSSVFSSPGSRKEPEPARETLLSCSEEMRTCSLL